MLFTVRSPIRAIARSVALHAGLSRIDTPVWPFNLPTPSLTSLRQQLMINKERSERGRDNKEAAGMAGMEGPTDGGGKR